MAWQRPPELVEVEVPRPGPGQLVVRVAGNGLCHSDVGMSQMPGAMAEMIGWRVPFTLGHEVGGWVEELGAGVVGVQPGDAVALVSPASDGTCRYCLRGQDSSCPDGRVGRGYGRDGGLAPLVLVDSTRFVIKLDQLDPLVAGPLTDAGELCSPNFIYAVAIAPSGTAALNTYDTHITPPPTYPVLSPPLPAAACATPFTIAVTGGQGGAVVPAGINTNETLYFIRDGRALRRYGTTTTMSAPDSGARWICLTRWPAK